MAALSVISTFFSGYSNGTWKLNLAAFQSFRWTNLKLKPGTSSFFQTEVKSLRHVSRVRIKCDPEKAQSVQNWHIPSNIKGICPLLWSFLVRFFNNRTSSYLVDRKYRPFVWDQSCDEAFQHLKQLCTDVIISNWWWHIHIYMYAQVYPE